MMSPHVFLLRRGRAQRREPGAPRPSLILAAVALVLGIGAVSSASAQSLEPVQFYATYGTGDTGPNGPVSIHDWPGVGTQSVFLWATGGEQNTDISAGPVCTPTANGDELCGISFALDVTGGYQLIKFIPNPDFDHAEPPLPLRTMLVSSGRLVGNGFDLGVPTPVNRYLGELQLQANGTNGDSQIVVNGRAIGADLSMREINAEAIIVPEPNAVLMLGAGLLGLLVSTRTRRSQATGCLRARI